MGNKNKKGRVANEYGEFFLKDENTMEGKTGKYMADVSYISFDKVPEETQKQWKGRALVAPTFCIEIVSAKYGLKPVLRKMETLWMRHGTDIGVVICPFSKKYFVFEKETNGYSEYDIYKIFTHPLLLEYEGDFSKHVDEI